MSAESQTPWVVFMGAAAALVLTSILGVLVGQWCARYLSPKFLQRAAGISLLLIAGWLFWDVINV
jgi:putative Ca2+/H+ antiporter (TMEM165/GDT1 family)